jgi:hypothetical protein
LQLRGLAGSIPGGFPNHWLAAGSEGVVIGYTIVRTDTEGFEKTAFTVRRG